jgi:hypothetical protein
MNADTKKYLRSSAFIGGSVHFYFFLRINFRLRRFLLPILRRRRGLNAM